MSDSVGYISYKSPRTVIAETVYQFIHGSLYGAIWGMVSPFPAAGSAAAAKEAATGIFRPVPPFSSLSPVPQNAIFFGSILGVQRFSSKSIELLRRKEDILNDLLGFGIIWPYYHFFLNHSERRLLLHNRVVGGSVILAVAYANLLA